MGNPIFTNEGAYKTYLLQEYVEEGGNRCPAPNCKSSFIEGDSYDLEGKVVYQSVHCTDCNATWVNVYTLKRAVSFEFGYQQEDDNE